MTFRIIVFNFMLLVVVGANGQTCCSAGAPVSSFLEISDANEKSMSIQLNYEYKSINLLVDNNSRLENDERTRYGQNISLKLDYILNSKWAFSASLPFVLHSRNTLSEHQRSFGIGDLSLLSQYMLFRNSMHNMNVSAGIKLPIGTTSNRGPSQIFLSPDMQSGSGSFDFLARIAYSKTDFIVPFLSSSFSAIYRKNGTNNNFGSTDGFEGRRFAFGDEFTSIFGLRYMQTLSSGFFIPDASLKIRWGNPNVEQNVASPNSGGRWLSIPLGFTFVPDDTKSIRLYTEIPIDQDLNGLQITTDYIIGIQFTYNRKGKNIDLTQTN